MSNYKHEIQANSFRSNDGTDIVTRDGKQAYEEVYHVGDFSNDQLINKRAVQEMIDGGAVTAESIDIPIGSVINSDGFVVVPYAGLENHGDLPDYWVNRYETGYKTKFYPDTRVYPDTGTPIEIWVYLADVDDGTGHTANRNELVVK